MRPFFETNDQSWVFLSMVYLGLILGLLYDVLGVFRKSGKKVWIIAADILFFLLAALGASFALIQSGQENIRIYALLGLVCGAMIYLLGLHRLFAGLFSWIWKRIVSPISDAVQKVQEGGKKGKKQAGKDKRI